MPGMPNISISVSVCTCMYVCMYVCLSVCLSARMSKNTMFRFHDIFHYVSLVTLARYSSDDIYPTADFVDDIIFLYNGGQ